MTLLSESTQRIQWLLQDVRVDVTTISKVVTAHQESLQQLARQGAFTQIQWVNAVENQALYTLPTPVVTISYVLYNQKVLRFATERSLDRLFHAWESRPGEPEYWTTSNQSPNTIRLISTPKRTGSTIPVIPSPLFQDMIDNLVIFHTEDVSEGLLDPEDVLPTLADWDDWLVWHTTKALAERETPEQNLPVAALCGQLEQIWMQLLQRG